MASNHSQCLIEWAVFHLYNAGTFPQKGIEWPGVNSCGYRFAPLPRARREEGRKTHSPEALPGLGFPDYAYK